MSLPLDELLASPALLNQQAQDLDWDELLYEYERAVDDVQAWLRGLNEAQIHFKPTAQHFSIADIVTHNCFHDELVLGWLTLLMQQRAAEIDPKTLISGGGARHTATLLDLEGLNEGCRTLARNTIETRPDPADLTATAPHPDFGALNAKGWLYFMALHRGLHRRQCEQVIDSPGFPHSISLQSQPREAYQPADRKPWLAQTVDTKKLAAKSRKNTGSKKPAAKKKSPAKARQK